MRALTATSVAAVCAVLAPGASAQTAFDAVVSGGPQQQAAAGTCPAGTYLCDAATIPGFGDARYAFAPLGRFIPVSGPLPAAPPSPDTECVRYAARVTFTLLSDGSALNLDETGTVCYPGDSSGAQVGRPSFGNDFDAAGTWTVTAGSGRFAGARGSGTDTIHSAGGWIGAHYDGGLTS
jgi:hypothetical protein